MARTRTILCSAALLAMAFSPAFAVSPQVDPRIFARKAPGQKESFLVLMREQADLSGAASIPDRIQRVRFVYEALQNQARASQAALRGRLDAAGIAYRSYYLVNMIEVEGDESLALSLAVLPEVSEIVSNAPFALSRVPREPSMLLSKERPSSLSTVEPNIAKIRAPEVWARGFTGQGVVIGMADTGVAWDHPALKSHYRGFDGVGVSHDYNWHDAIHDAGVTNPCGSNSPVPCDDDGHGTSTASLAVGDDGEGTQVGAAPGSRFIACRNMDQGNGTPARYTECFQFFLAPTDLGGLNPRPDLAANVISNSWGCPASEGCTDPEVLKAVVENVRAAGIFVAVAASNDGPSCASIDIPALYEASFAVGATDESDFVANFSSRGPVTADGSDRLKPDLCAPGVLVRVASKFGGYEGGFSGTSASTPEVAGSVALLWSAAPQMIGQIDATTLLLERTAVPLTSTQDCAPYPGGVVPNAVFGFGRLDIATAVDAVAPPPREDLTSIRRERPLHVVPER